MGIKKLLSHEPLCTADNITAALDSSKTTLYLQNLHDLAIFFFPTKITKLSISFYLQKLPDLKTNFEVRDRDHNGSRPRPVQNSRYQDRDHKKLVSRPTALASSKY